MKVIVEANAVGGWDVRLSESTERLFRGDRASAEAVARQACTAAGGTVHILGPGGRALEQIEVQAPAAAPDIIEIAGPALQAAAKAGVPGATKVTSEGKHVNRALDVALPLFGSFGAAWLSPEVTQFGSTWIAVFFATLTWSLGCAIATYLIRSESLNGMPAFIAAGLSLVVALLIATGLGFGMLSVDVASVSSPPEVVARFFMAALQTYGIFGTLVSGAIGVWLGWRFSEESSS